jgi:serine/threonine protein kinase/tetratricopeptide (TPR) repeat protein
MKPTDPSHPPIDRDADADWINHRVSALLFGDVPGNIGRFTILGEIGSGGMGLVYRALDPELDRTLAVKLLNTDCSNPEGVRRMQQEAQAMARLSHPHVVQVYEVGQHRDQVFLAMEYVEGGNLEAWLRHPRPRQTIETLFLAIGEGVAAAHSVGIVHRDLKPANILVDRTGRPKVADFGLARTDTFHELERLPTLPDAHHGHSRLTAPGQRIGTPRYMAPEQHAGQPATPASDQFSFCMMLWEALHAELPFPDPTATTTLSRDHWKPRPPPRGSRLPARMHRTLARGLEQDPSRRWPTMVELLAELARPSWFRRHPLLMWTTSVLIAVGTLVPAIQQLIPTAEPSPCDPVVELLREHESSQMQRWHVALAERDPSPTVRRYLEGTLADWSTEIVDVCHDPSRVLHAERARDLLRRGACIVLNAELLELWSSAAPTAAEPAASIFNIRVPPPPREWHLEGLGRSCLLTESESYDLLRGAGPPRRAHAAQEMLNVRLLLQVGRSHEALLRLEALSLHLPPEPPASYHLLRARTLRADHADPTLTMRALYAAENAAEHDGDELTLFDARIEQSHLTVATHAAVQQYHQVAPLRALDDTWEHHLDTAGTLLRRRRGAVSDDALRLLLARVELADSRGDDASALRQDLVAAAAQPGNARLRAEIYSDHASHLDSVGDSVAAAKYDDMAIAVAPRDDELLGYLNYNAGIRAFDRGDVAAALRSMRAAERHYRQASGADAPELAIVAYATAQALYTAGEAAAALPFAETALLGSQRGAQPLQLAIAYYLRSAIHIRLGHPAEAIQDASAALACLPNAGPDLPMWRTTLQTAMVEAQIASGADGPAIQSATILLRELDARPALDLGGQRDELQLALATAWLRRGRPRAAAAALTRADNPEFFAYDEFKRAEALRLRAGLPGLPAATAQSLAAEATKLFRKLGSDGAARLAATP